MRKFRGNPSLFQQLSVAAIGVLLFMRTCESSGSGTLKYSASGLPGGLKINTSTGAITGTAAAGDAIGGPYSVTVTASDGTYSASQTFGWTITGGITIADIPVQVDQLGGAVDLKLVASATTGGALTYMASGLPNGLSINASTGEITGTIAASSDSVGSVLSVVAVTDGTTNQRSIFTWNITAFGLGLPSAISESVAAIDEEQDPPPNAGGIDKIIVDPGTGGLTSPASPLVALPGGVSYNTIPAGPIATSTGFSYGFHVRVEVPVGTAIRAARISQTIFVLIERDKNPGLAWRLVDASHSFGRPATVQDYETARKEWQTQTNTWANDPVVGANLWSDDSNVYKHGANWVEYGDAPGASGLPGASDYPVLVGADIYWWLAVRITVVFPDGKKIVATFYEFQSGYGNSVSGSWQLYKSSVDPTLPHTWTE
jgi:hypothetical protein